jgi:nucleoid DNA-binding protein
MSGKKKAVSKSLTQAQLIAELADATGRSKAEVKDMFDHLFKLVKAQLAKGYAVTLPGLVKIELKKKAARAARPGRNPATGETIMIKAKPASMAVKAKPIKALKELAK